MNHTLKTLGTLALMASLAITMVPTSQAATSLTINSDVTVADIAGSVVKMTQSSADSSFFTSGKVIGDSTHPVLVNYVLYSFDRNGELDLAQAGNAVTLKLYKPAADGTPQETNLATATNQVSVSMCAGLTQAGSTLQWSGNFPTDATALNGVKSCSFSITYNSAGISSSGEYELQATIGSTIQKISTVVYVVLDYSLSAADSAGSNVAGGAISFGSLNPTQTGVAANRVKVANSHSGAFTVGMAIPDLICSTGVCSGGAAAVTTVPSTLFRVKQATTQGTDPGNAAATDTAPTGGMIQWSRPVASGANERYSFFVGAVNNGNVNKIMTTGLYTGVITVSISADPASSPYAYNGATYSPANPLLPQTLDLASNPPDGLGAITIA